MLKTIEEHQKLAFTHIMKHYKQAGKSNPVSRGAVTTDKQSLLLRYYPPSDRKLILNIVNRLFTFLYIYFCFLRRKTERAKMLRTTRNS